MLMRFIVLDRCRVGTIDAKNVFWPAGVALDRFDAHVRSRGMTYSSSISPKTRPSLLSFAISASSSEK